MLKNVTRPTRFNKHDQAPRTGDSRVVARFIQDIRYDTGGVSGSRIGYSQSCRIVVELSLTLNSRVMTQLRDRMDVSGAVACYLRYKSRRMVDVGFASSVKLHADHRQTPNSSQHPPLDIYKHEVLHCRCRHCFGRCRCPNPRPIPSALRSF